MLVRQVGQDAPTSQLHRGGQSNKCPQPYSANSTSKGWQQKMAACRQRRRCSCAKCFYQCQVQPYKAQTMVTWPSVQRDTGSHPDHAGIHYTFMPAQFRYIACRQNLSLNAATQVSRFLPAVQHIVQTLQPSKTCPNGPARLQPAQEECILTHARHVLGKVTVCI